jgi:cell division protein FtsI (penicillin-binding protein 3)
MSRQTPQSTPRGVRSAPAVTTPAPRALVAQPWRFAVVLVLTVLVMARIVVQLVDIQLLDRQAYAQKAEQEIVFTKPIPAQRGMIRDRFGSALALDVERESLYVNPREIPAEDAVRIAQILEGWLDLPAEEILAKIIDTKREWVPVARWLDPAVADKIRLLEEPALKLEYETKRFYPQGDFAAHVVGTVNTLGGISGIESSMNDILMGSSGVITAEITASGGPIWAQPYDRIEPRRGGDIELTIDPFIQHVAERELRRAVTQHVASGGSIIVMDIKTGAIRAMASAPSFDPNIYYEYKPEVYYNNPAVNAQYEPGSTFKILTVAAGLQANAFDEKTTVVDEGVVRRYDYNIKNFDARGNGVITPGQVLYYSSNVGAILFGEMMGESIFYKAIESFGFGTLTGIELPAETAGTVKWPGTEGYTPVDFNTNTFGQGISATPLQVVRMAATVANDGVMMRPYIVQRVCDTAGACTSTEPREQGRPISPEVARSVRQMLMASANHYVNAVQPDTLWLVPGFQVGAKTGTSSIPDLVRGGYEDRTIGSVVGMAPIEAPRYAVLVKIDRPSDDIWGVRTALPVYRAVVAELMRYDRISPNNDWVGSGQRPGAVNDN